MARPNKMWWWEARGEWCVTIRGERHRLGEDQKAAKFKFHQLLSQPEEAPKQPEPAIETVAAVFERFLEWTQNKREPATYQWYRKHLQSFLDSLEVKTLTVQQMKPHHVHSWADGMTAGDTFRRGAMTAVARAFNWAVKMGHLDVSPIPKLEKPAAKSREQMVSAEEYEAVLKQVTGGFRDLIVTSWETGCRPQEITRVEAKDVEIENGRWYWPAGKAPKGKKERSVYLTDTALEITKRLMDKHRTGPLFVNQDGQPWTSFAINCNFLRLQTAMGRRETEVSDAEIEKRMRVIEKNRKSKGKPPLKEFDVRYQAKKALLDSAARKNAPKYCLYAFRHSYCTHGLKNGTDPVTMGKLMGHADLAMIYKIYNHIAQDPAFMLSAARKVAK